MPDGTSSIQKLMPVYHCTRRTTGMLVDCVREERATPYRFTGEHIVRERFGDERINGPHFDFGGPAGSYDQMVSDDATP